MLLYSIYVNNIQLHTPFPDFSRMEVAAKVEQKKKKIWKVEELSCLFNKVLFITEMDKMGDTVWR